MTIKIYDMLGNVILVLLDEYRSAGKHYLQFNASGLSSGVYFINFKSGSYSETRKMMLMK
jgi:hypothetical protein